MSIMIEPLIGFSLGIEWVFDYNVLIIDFGFIQIMFDFEMNNNV